MEHAIDEVNYNGVFWKDIKWNHKIHAMEYCDDCGSDGAEGHQNACRYLYKNQQSPAGRTFLQTRIKEALEREVAAGMRASS